MGNGKFYGMKYEKLWENMGKIYIYIYIYVYNYIYIFRCPILILCLFFRMVHGFPIYIFNMPHVDDMLSESDMNGYSSGNKCRWFLSVFSDTPRCLAIVCEICESQNGRLKP